MKINFLLFFFLSAVFAFSQKEKTPDIDKQLKLCLDSSQNQTTLGMLECTGKAEDAWDRELNKYYKLLMGILTPDEKAKLKAAQKNWLAYRDSEQEFAYTSYTNLQGTTVESNKCHASHAAGQDTGAGAQDVLYRP